MDDEAERIRTRLVERRWWLVVELYTDHRHPSDLAVSRKGLEGVLDMINA